MMSGDPNRMVEEMQVPRDLISLSRRILHWANLGTPRLEFLHEVTRLLIEFARCDLLQIRCWGAELSYRWTLRTKPEERSVFESIDEQGPKHGMDRIAEALAHDEIEPGAPCLTRQGSFWTGNAAEALAGFDVPRSAQVEQGFESIRSLLLIPFEIQDGDGAYLLLGSQQGDFFRHERIEILETLAQTLAQAIADRRSQASLRERVKELSCLYRISRIMADAERSIDERLQQIVQQLPVAWQYPENAVAQVILDDRVFGTGSVEAARFRQSASIKVAGRTRGSVELVYAGDRAEFVEGPFLPEEQSLIDGIARELSLFVERNELRHHREQLEQQLRHADRLAMIGELASGVAHEINGPLESILGFAQLLRNAKLAEDQQKDLTRIITAGLHAREIVRKLVLFARREPLKKGAVDLNEIVDESLTMLEAQCAKSEMHVTRELADDLPDIAADAVQLRQVVLNLAMNAVQAMPDGGTLKLSTCVRDDAVMLTVEDTGVGMTDDVMQKLFTPFYTTKDVGEGTGLGLSVVHGIVNAHGGAINVKSRPGHGTLFEVQFPLGNRKDLNPQ